MAELSVSILAYEGELDKKSRLIKGLADEADYIHVDVVRTNERIVFCKEDFEKIYARFENSAKLDIHYLGSYPLTFLENQLIFDFSFPFEFFSRDMILENLKKIKLTRKGGRCRVGISLEPSTSLDPLDYRLLKEVKQVLLVGTSSGVGAGKYDERVTEKLRELRRRKEREKLDFAIKVDGGINEGNIGEIRRFADVVVIGSAITSAEYPIEEARKFREILRG